MTYIWDYFSVGCIRAMGAILSVASDLDFIRRRMGIMPPKFFQSCFSNYKDFFIALQ